MICNICLRSMNSTIPGEDKASRSATKLNLSGVLERPHHETAASFFQSVRARCFICTSVYKEHGLNRLDENKISRIQFKDQFTKMTLSYTDTTELKVGVWLPRAVFPFPYTDFFLRPSDAEQRSKPLKQADEIDLARNRLELAQSWFETCNASHQCAQLCNETFAPSRVLQLSRQSATDEGHWRLVVSKEHADLALHKYATISHRWDSSNQLKLTVSNMQLLKQHQPDSTLPSKFRIATDVARYLGIEFLWIDSLCIVQDSREDWHTESMLMHMIYRQSLCNITIGHAVRSSLQIPLLKGQEICQPHWKARLRAADLDKIPQVLRSATGKKSYYVMHSGFWKANIYNSHLSDRGWIFQELILSQRTLHLYEDQAFWQCGELKASESFVHGIPRMSKAFTADPISRFADDFLQASISTPWKADTTERKVDEAWINLVETYSASKLSFSRDKLVALAGVAKVVQQIRPDEYFAGIFRRYLPSALIWHVAAASFLVGELSHGRPKKYRAPSWSWASIDRPVTLWKVGHYAERPIAAVKEIITTSPTGDPFGELNGGYVVISTRPLVVGIAELTSATIGQEVTSLPYPHLTLGIRGVSIYLDLQQQPRDLKLVFTPIMTYGDSFGTPTIDGLLLKPISNRTWSEFTRIGFLSINLKRPDTANLEDPESLGTWNRSNDIYNLDSWFTLEESDITIY